jgi:TRAP-type C4-dicarboxylate transport system permease large subunit
VPVGVIYRGIMPFLVADFVLLALVLFLPQLTLWVLRFMR